MENNTNNKEQKDSQDKDNGNNFMVPASIVVAGIVVAGAIMYSSGVFGNVPQQAAVGQPPGGPPTTPIDFKLLELRSDDQVLGNPSAKVKIIEYGDFECPFCGKMFNEVLGSIKEEYVKTGKAVFVYRHFPLNQIHPEAQKSAEASECAGEQGKFWEMHDILFERQAQLSMANYKNWAAELGLDLGKFSGCLDSGKYTGKVESMYKDGVSAGVSGTPATFVNGILVAGAQAYGAFKSVIEAELDK